MIIGLGGKGGRVEKEESAEIYINGITRHDTTQGRGVALGLLQHKRLEQQSGESVLLCKRHSYQNEVLHEL